MPPMRHISGRFHRNQARAPIAILALGVFLAVSLGDFLAWGGLWGRHWWIDGGWTLAGALATASCLRTAVRSRGRDRLIWLLFGVGCASWFVGQLAWDYYELFASFPPSPSLADIGYLGLVPACVAGFVAMSISDRSSRLLIALDIGALAFVFSVLFMTFFWHDVARSPLSDAGRITDLLYPVFYATLACSLLVVPIRQFWQPGQPVARYRSLGLLLLGLLGQAIPFILWTPATLGNSFQEGGAFDIVWMLGMLLIAASAASFDHFPSLDGESQLFGIVAYLPLGFSGIAIGVRFVDFLALGMDRNTQKILGTLILGVAICTVLRLAVTIMESRDLFLRAKRSAAALVESEERFRAIFKWAPVGIEIADLEGRLVATNEALQEMLGYTEEELQLVAYTAISHPEDIPAEAAMDDELIAGLRDHYQIEKRHIRKDGAIIWTRLTASEVRDDDGNPRFAIGMVEDITDRKEAKEALEYQAMHDALTGLPNRALFRDRLEQALLSASRSGTSCSLILMDLNGFKEINDTFGHEYGDAVLQQMATRLATLLRASDTVARLGGDEFAMVLPSAAESDAVHVATKITESFSSPVRVYGQSLYLEASVGISAYPEHGSDATGLLRQADIAMYVAKRTGTQFAVYETGQDEEAQRRIMLVGALRQAIEFGQLILHYQPKADCRTGQVVGVEALVRWQHPIHGMIRPDEFIPLAEHSGLIKPLTSWVLDEALRQVSEWRAKGVGVPVWVNLSVRTLHDRDLPSMVAGLLRSHNLSPEWLGLEITESAVMTDPARALEILQGLNTMGVHIAMDDFGTGYSSLSYLQRLPVCEIKIDRSFVIDMSADRGARSIVRATINLAHDLGLQVVAEGVEHQEGWNSLDALRCDLVQGYYLCRPLPAEELTPWLLGRKGGGTAQAAAG